MVGQHQYSSRTRMLLVVAFSFIASAVSAQESRLDRVLSQKSVAIGLGYSAPPMNYMDHGVWAGFDMDLARAVVARLPIPGIKVEFVKVDTTTRVVFLTAGRVDMTISSMSHTRQREQAIDFAEPPYLWAGKQFYARKGRFSGYHDLVGKRIAVQQGSNAGSAATQLLKSLGDPNPIIASYPTDGEAFLALKQGKVDAFTQDNVIALGVMGTEAKDFEAVGPVYSPGLYSIGLPSNDSKWRDAVSIALQQVIQDGTYDSIYEEWFGAEGKFPLAANARPRLPEDAFGRGVPFIWPD
ncbi:transporter substrate-binding domain-containing protein [Bradyrhizobium diazoefficiens]|nr:transporter substrate-binding domain-containing protein [Bradyrhizobium diazoefficiens]MBR0965670.1 transporter substrate-binding domain-containing protein [Bradyrhizobium diazoefficiens]MBR0979362.1 transporter substrate-binding domain-containing protein [Bradyrhizobium diazoefficiens]MBR1008554.1 transporter substrate-binding domain-containing protein [Bradyrhizobium diazoefficiens]MBR1014697.1 transporter substrate-binding domain-containing protein [Bradyrhizobium diazoefficiens]MBR10525